MDENKLLDNSKDNATFNRYTVIRQLLSLNDGVIDEDNYPIYGLLYGYDIIVNKELKIFPRIKGNGFKAEVNNDEAILIAGLDIRKNKIKHNMPVNGKIVSKEITLLEYMAIETKSYLIAKSEFKNNDFDEKKEIESYLKLLKFNFLLNVLINLNDIKIKQSLYKIGVKNVDDVTSAKVEPIF